MDVTSIEAAMADETPVPESDEETWVMGVEQSEETEFRANVFVDIQVTSFYLEFMMVLSAMKEDR